MQTAVAFVTFQLKSAMMQKTIILLCLLCGFTCVQAQDLLLADVDAGRPITEVEPELAALAFDVLNHDSTAYKFKTNKEFFLRLLALLKRPESYAHPFDSLRTVSVIGPENGSFRIFTWYIVDQPKEAYYSSLAHYYYGIIQRKHVDESGNEQVIAIPLRELESIPKGFEQTVTDQMSWLGALYYLPRNQEHVQSFSGYSFKMVDDDKVKAQKKRKDKDITYTFVPGRYRSRRAARAEMPDMSGHKWVKEKIDYYVLMGWNGWDNKSNYKVLEILSFDPDDPAKVNFGAPILYFDKRIPKSRALFKYSEYAPFSLNMDRVKLSAVRKPEVIVFDHMAPPNVSKKTAMWENGPDGSTDALTFHKRYGFFRFHRDVVLFNDYNKAYTPRQLKRQLKRQEQQSLERLEEAGIELEMEKKE